MYGLGTRQLTVVLSPSTSPWRASLEVPGMILNRSCSSGSSPTSEKLAIHWPDRLAVTRRNAQTLSLQMWPTFTSLSGSAVPDTVSAAGSTTVTANSLTICVFVVVPSVMETTWPGSSANPPRSKNTKVISGSQSATTTVSESVKSSPTPLSGSSIVSVTVSSRFHS